MIRTRPNATAPSLTLFLAALLAGTAGATAHQAPQTPAPPKTGAGATMQIDAWTTLGPPAARLDMTPAQPGAEQITVIGRTHHPEAEWREALAGRAPVYEAGQSVSAQRLYAAGPEWASPEHQRLMSDAKDAMGLCGALFGLVSCPNK